jgi:hypothetical protein
VAPPVLADGTKHASGGLGTQRVAGIAVAGIGVAGLVVGGVFGIRTIDLKNQRSQYCDGNNMCTDPQGVTLDHDARTSATISTISMIAGGVVAAGGLVLVLTAPRAPTSVTVGAGMRADVAELTVAGQW